MLRRSAVIAIAGSAVLGAPWVHASTAGAFTARDPLVVSTDRFWSVPRWVWMRRPATGEEIKIEYWRDGVLDAQAYRRLCWFMRDVRFERLLLDKSSAVYRAQARGQIKAEDMVCMTRMDPVLIDILYAYSAWLAIHGVKQPLLFTSGFRHLFTNARTEGAAQNSWHPKGGAGDIVIPGVPVVRSAEFGRWIAGGGVGLYVNKGFVHLDRGNVRSWRG